VTSLVFMVVAILTPGTGADSAAWATAAGVWMCAAYLAKRDEEGK
jgi:hypothetical protein